VHRFLGPHHRAGQGVLTAGTPNHEDTIYRAAGFIGPRRLEVPGWVVERTADEIVVSVHSLSGSLPTSSVTASASSTPTCASCSPPPATAASASRSGPSACVFGPDLLALRQRRALRRRSLAAAA
jgi:hypothetical protein